MQGTAIGPVAQQPRPVTGIGRGEAELGGVLAHGIEVDQRPLAVIPEQVMALEVAMADALADQVGKQAIKRLQFVRRWLKLVLLQAMLLVQAVVVASLKKMVQIIRLNQLLHL